MTGVGGKLLGVELDRRRRRTYGAETGLSVVDDTGMVDDPGMVGRGRTVRDCALSAGEPFIEGMLKLTVMGAGFPTAAAAGA